jgi:hypothetical protein
MSATNAGTRANRRIRAYLGTIALIKNQETNGFDHERGGTIYHSSTGELEQPSHLLHGLIIMPTILSSKAKAEPYFNDIL